MNEIAIAIEQATMNGITCESCVVDAVGADMPETLTLDDSVWGLCSDCQALLDEYGWV